MKENVENSEDQFKNIFENSTIGIYRTTPDGKILMANNAAVNLLGFDSFDELKKRNLEKEGFAPEYSRKKFKKRIEEEGEVKGLEAAWKKKDGTTIYVRESAKAIKGEHGKIKFYDGTIEDITKRKKAEKERDEIAQILKATLESTADGILVVDNDRNFLTANKIFAEMWDIPEKIFQEKDNGRLLNYVVNHLKDPKEFIKKLDELHRNPELTSFDRIYFKDGRIFERYSRPLMINDQPHGRVWNYHDITERQKAQQKLQTIFDMSLDIICIADYENDTFLKVNHAFTNILGYSKSEIFNASISDFIHPDDMEATKEIIENELEQGKSVNNFQNRYKTKDGNYRWLEWACQPSNKKGVSYSVARDITDKKQSEQKLIESENKFHSLVEQAAEMLFLHDTEGYIMEINKAAQKNTGYTRQELLDMNILEIDPNAKNREDKIIYWERLNINDPPVTFQSRHQRKDGSIYPAEITISKIKISDKNYILALARNISERKKAEKKLKDYRQHLEKMIQERTEKLKAAHKELIEKEKLASLGKFAGGLVHEIKNPLAIIDSSAINLKFQDYKDKKIDDHIQRIRKAVKKSTKTIDSLRRLSKMQSPDLKKLSINNCMEEIINQIKPYDNVQINFNPSAQNIIIEADKDQLQLCFTNLIKNAVEAINKEGSVEIELKVNSSQKCEIKIKDNGIGIEPKKLNKIFDPLYSSKSDGLGFGLFLVKQIISSHSGEINVKSKPGKGTVFSLTLPVLKTEEN